MIWQSLTIIQMQEPSSCSPILSQAHFYSRTLGLALLVAIPVLFGLAKVSHWFYTHPKYSLWMGLFRNYGVRICAVSGVGMLFLYVMLLLIFPNPC